MLCWLSRLCVRGIPLRRLDYLRGKAHVTRWAHKTQHARGLLDRFSRFFRAHNLAQLTDHTMLRHLYQQATSMLCMCCSLMIELCCCHCLKTFT